MAAPELWLIAGPNGAGKTTAMSSPFVRELVAHVRFLNADDRTLEKLRAEGWSGFADTPGHRLRALFVEAADEVQSELEAGLARGESLGVETVLSTLKYQAVVEWVLGVNGVFNLLYVGLRSPELSASRVAQRVGEGGHDVPLERLAARWQRSIANLGWFAVRADRCYVFDNSDSHDDEPPLLIAQATAGRLDVFHPDAIPQITASLTAAFSTAR